MKTYEEMIQWEVNQVENGKIRYYEWPAILAIAEVYGIQQEQVFIDINFEKDLRKQSKKEVKKTESRAMKKLIVVDITKE